MLGVIGAKKSSSSSLRSMCYCEIGNPCPQVKLDSRELADAGAAVMASGRRVAVRTGDAGTSLPV